MLKELVKLDISASKQEPEEDVRTVALYGGQGTSKARMTTEFDRFNFENRIDEVAARIVKQKLAEAVNRQLQGVEAAVEVNGDDGQQVKSIE